MYSDNINTKMNSLSFEKLMLCHEDNFNVFEELKKSMTNKVIVPFIGAGLSAFVYPMWKQLLSEIADRYGINKDINDLLEHGEYEKAASFIEDKVVRYDFLVEIYNAFHPKKLEQHRLTDTIKLIPYLWKGNIITTNFDRIIETAYYEADMPIERIVPHTERGTLYSNIAIQKNSSILIKLHGDIEDNYHLVLTENEYNTIYGTKRNVNLDLPMPSILKKVLSSHMILFLGCGLAEDRTLEVVKACAEEGCQHFALVELPKITENISNPFSPILKSANGLLFSDYDERRRHLARHNIRRIWYPYGQHNAVKTLLSEFYNIFVNKKQDFNSFISTTKNRDKLEVSSKKKNIKLEYDPFYPKKPEGIIPREDLEVSERMHNEVFSIELLTKDIVIKKWGREDNEICIYINRKDAKYAIVTDKGKETLNKKIINTNKKRSRLLNLDMKIQNFLNSTSLKGNSEKLIKLSQEKLMLRWASAGIISIVEYKNKKWIPLFYRDKAPYGWNIALGDSERHFDNMNNLVCSVNEELNFPSVIMLREFDEEFLVLEDNPVNTKNSCRYIPFRFSSNITHDTNKFNKEHLNLRQKYDDLNFVKSGDRIKCSTIETNTSISICSENENELYELDNVLVSFNLLELGIEVAQVFKYKLDRNNIILDSEILTYYDKNTKKSTSEIVRMPIALISCDYLEKKFKGDISSLKYTDSLSNPSIVIDEPIVNNPSNESNTIILFDYDLRQRMNVIKGEKKVVGDSELERYKISFEKFFEEINGNFFIKSDASRYFTPATAKLLNQLFNNIDPKEYK